MRVFVMDVYTRDNKKFVGRIYTTIERELWPYRPGDYSFYAVGMGFTTI